MIESDGHMVVYTFSLTIYLSPTRYNYTFIASFKMKVYQIAGQIRQYLWLYNNRASELSLLYKAAIHINGFIAQNFSFIFVCYIFNRCWYFFVLPLPVSLTHLIDLLLCRTVIHWIIWVYRPSSHTSIHPTIHCIIYFHLNHMFGFMIVIAPSLSHTLMSSFSYKISICYEAVVGFGGGLLKFRPFDAMLLRMFPPSIGIWI